MQGDIYALEAALEQQQQKAQKDNHMAQQSNAHHPHVTVYDEDHSPHFLLHQHGRTNPKAFDDAELGRVYSQVHYLDIVASAFDDYNCGDNDNGYNSNRFSFSSVDECAISSDDEDEDDEEEHHLENSGFFSSSPSSLPPLSSSSVQMVSHSHQDEAEYDVRPSSSHSTASIGSIGSNGSRLSNSSRPSLLLKKKRGSDTTTHTRRLAMSEHPPTDDDDDHNNNKKKEEVSVAATTKPIDIIPAEQHVSRISGPLMSWWPAPVEMEWDWVGERFYE